MADELHEVPDTAVPLSQRMPGYLFAFGAGLAGSLAAGLLVWWWSDNSLGGAVGYTLVFYGVLLLLVGGSVGGGYTNLGLGAVEALVGGRNRVDEDTSDPEVRLGRRPTRDPMERLRRGLRPKANPSAFWKVIGGVAYVALGLALLSWAG